MKNLLLLTPGMISVYESNLTSKTRTVLTYELFVRMSPRQKSEIVRIIISAIKGLLTLTNSKNVMISPKNPYFLENFTFADFAAFCRFATQRKSPIFLIFFTIVTETTISPFKKYCKNYGKVRLKNKR